MPPETHQNCCPLFLFSFNLRFFSLPEPSILLPEISSALTSDTTFAPSPERFCKVETVILPPSSHVTTNGRRIGRVNQEGVNLRSSARFGSVSSL